mmetsp:Transcript_72413/g.172583  ORF Transcript_72413/g.172583 Transcript_72413/m.172583 type:complete len:248 (+) Transcript_72413:169-912(+)
MPASSRSSKSSSWSRLTQYSSSFTPCLRIAPTLGLDSIEGTSSNGIHSLAAIACLRVACMPESANSSYSHSSSSSSALHIELCRASQSASALLIMSDCSSSREGLAPIGLEEAAAADFHFLAVGSKSSKHRYSLLAMSCPACSGTWRMLAETICLAIFSSTSPAASISAAPLCPPRAVRPIRRMNSAPSRGQSYMTTHSTGCPLKSMPLDKRSVQIKTFFMKKSLEEALSLMNSAACFLYSFGSCAE